MIHWSVLTRSLYAAGSASGCIRVIELARHFAVIVNGSPVLWPHIMNQDAVGLAPPLPVSFPPPAEADVGNCLRSEAPADIQMK